MKYHRAALLLAITTSSIYPQRTTAYDRTREAQDVISETIPRSPMHGYCIGCVLTTTTRTGDIDELELLVKTTSSIEEDELISPLLSYSSGDPEHSTCAKKKLFLPSPKNIPPKSPEQQTTYSNTPEQHFQYINLHQINLTMISKSIHNKAFLQDLLALSLFLIALAVGFAWCDDVYEEEHLKRFTADYNNKKKKFDLVSNRLISDEFGDVELTSTNDSDDGEEEHVNVKEENVKENATMFPLQVTTTTKEEPQVTNKPKEPQWTLRYRGEWQPSQLTSIEEEINTEKEEVIILTKPVLGKDIKSSILAGSPSNTECLSLIKVRKRVSFGQSVGQEKEEVARSDHLSSSITKKRKGLWLKLKGYWSGHEGSDECPYLLFLDEEEKKMIVTTQTKGFHFNKILDRTRRK